MHKTKRLLGALTAALMTITAFPAATQVQAADAVLKFEFEDGTLTDCEENAPITWEQVDEDGFGDPCDMTGWSGDSYVYIDRKDAAATVTVDIAQEGFYTLKLAYIQCFGTPDNPNKTQYLLVNGESQGEVLFPFNSGKGWEELQAGYVWLDKGKNEITIKSYWGYTFLDYLTLSPAPAYLSDLSPTRSLCDPDATDEAKRLYSYLCDMYGNHIISGQQEYCGSHCYNKNAYETEGKPINYFESNEQEFEYILEQTGKQPAIRGIDLLFYNTTEPYFDDAPERVIAWYKDKGGIPTVTYHWNVPTDGKGSTAAAFYVESTGNTPFTNFSVTNAVKEGTWEREQIDKDLALLAEQFQKIQDAGVPVIFRPLHEAEGAWFWWGAEGPEACKALYHYLYETLTEQYGIHNLIWEWTSSTNVTAADWYPGDDYVDMVSIDKYNAVNYQPNESAISASFYSLVGSTEGRKMVAMSENDTIPSLENLVNDKAYWLYFCPWYGNFLTDLTAKDKLDEIYNSDYCITLDELPDLTAYPLPDEDAPPKPTAPTEDDPTSPPDSVLYGDVNDDTEVDILDVIMLNKFLLGVVSLDKDALVRADVDTNGKADSTDSLNILKCVVKILKEFPVK